MGRPSKPLPRGVMIREIELAFTGGWWPLTVQWERRTPTLAVGRVVAIDGESCEPFTVSITSRAAPLPTDTELRMTIYGNQTKDDACG